MKDIMAFGVLFLFEVICFHSVLVGEKTFLGSGDAAMQTYAWMAKICEAVKNNEFALWDFNISGGLSFVGEIQTAPFYFGNILFALMMKDVTQHAVDIYILIHFFCGSFFMYKLLRYNKQNTVASIGGAIVFEYIGSVSARASAQPNIFMGLIWLPLIIWCFQHVLDNDTRNKKIIWSLVSGFFLGMMILAGHMQPYIHAVIALGFLVICYSKGIKELINNLLWLVLLGITSLFFCFGQVVSGLEYMNLSYRWIGLEEPIKGLNKLPDGAYDFVITKIQNIKDIVIDTGEIGDSCTLYISIIGVVLFFIGIVGISFMKSKKVRFNIYAVTMLVFAFVASFGGQNIVGKLLTIIPVFSNVREPARILYLYNFSMAIVISVGIGILYEIIYKIKSNRVLYRCLYVVVTMLCFGCIGYSAYKFIDVRLEDADNSESAMTQYEHNDLVKTLEMNIQSDISQGKFYRYTCDTNESTLTPNLGNVYSGLFGTYGHRATMSITYFDYLNAKSWNWSESLGDDLAVKYFISNSPIDNKIKDKYELIDIKNEKYIYRRKNTSSYFEGIDSDGEKENVIFSNICFLTNNVSLQAKAPGNCSIRMAQLNYPGWKVYVDGQQKDIILDKNGFMIVNISEGVHEIKFAYSPWWINAWIIIIISYLFFIMGWIAVNMYSNKMYNT